MVFDNKACQNLMNFEYATKVQNTSIVKCEYKHHHMPKLKYRQLLLT